jgi:hypothetical protein
MPDYTIDQASWHLRAGSESRDKTFRRFRAVATFLQENGLTTRPLLPDGEVEIDESFRIHSSDLTADGLELMGRHYDRWLRGVDRGKPVEDLSILRKALSAIRERET